MSGGSFLVTGASGYIGRALCRRLRREGRVRALVRGEDPGPWDETVKADLEKDEIPGGAFDGVDTVFHLAARTHALSESAGDEAAYQRLNVDGTAKVLEACRRAGVKRLVFFSSVKAMGEGGPGILDEASRPRPTTAYGTTKLEAEKMVLGGGFVPAGVVLRLALVYGPGSKGNLTRMIEAIDRGAFPPVPSVKNRRSMVHVDDAVKASVLAAGAPPEAGNVFVVTDGKYYSTREMYEWIVEALGKKIPGWTAPVIALKALAKAGDLIGRARGTRWKFDSDAYEKLFGSACYSNGAISEKLGFEPEWDLKSALPDIVGAMRGGRKSP